MEENQQSSVLEMHLDYDGGNILKETVRWSRFLSIVGIIGVGIFILIFALAGTTILSLYSRVMPGIEAVAGLIIILFLVIFGIFGFLAYMLFRFSSLTRKAIDTQNQALFNQALKSLKVYFLISGIIAIIGLLFNLLSIVRLF